MSNGQSYIDVAVYIIRGVIDQISNDDSITLMDHQLKQCISQWINIDQNISTDPVLTNLHAALQTNSIDPS